PAQVGPRLPVRARRGLAGPGRAPDGARTRRRGGPRGGPRPLRLHSLRPRRGTPAPHARGLRPGRPPRPRRGERRLKVHVAVYLPLIVPACAALAARPLADRLPPAAATWLLTASALVLALASSAMLGVLALSALVRIPAVAALGHLSR